MGRWAFFNTGLEYKFVFSVQSSEDILRFGGWLRLAITTREDDSERQYDGGLFDSASPVVKWSAPEDGERILEKLREMEAALGLPACDFAKFRADLEGTYTLKNTLFDQTTEDAEAQALYVLGCLIYHQLLYMPALQANFEV
jgi:hypothetical protein